MSLPWEEESDSQSISIGIDEEEEESSDIAISRENIIGCFYTMVPRVVKTILLFLSFLLSVLISVLLLQYLIVMPLSNAIHGKTHNMTNGCPLDSEECLIHIICPTEPSFHFGCFGMGIVTLFLCIIVTGGMIVFFRSMWDCYKTVRKEEKASIND